MRIITLILFLIPALSYSQVKPAKKDNTIVIQGQKSITPFIGYLLKEGYFIDKSDTALGYVTTQYRELPKQASEYKLNAVYSDGSITLNGVYRVTIKSMSDRQTPIENFGMKNSIIKENFMKMLSVAEKYAKEHSGEVKTEKR